MFLSIFSAPKRVLGKIFLNVDLKQQSQNIAVINKQLNYLILQLVSLQIAYYGKKGN